MPVLLSLQADGGPQRRGHQQADDGVDLPAIKKEPVCYLCQQHWLFPWLKASKPGTIRRAALRSVPRVTVIAGAWERP